MLKNYFKIAWRNLLKNKVYSFINVVGLALGMSVAMLIGLWIADELTYDHVHINHSRLGQLMSTQTFDGHTTTGPAIAIPLSNELKTKYASDFKNVSLASWNQPFTLMAGETKIADNGMWVQPEFPQMLGLHMLQGDVKGLNDPSSMLLTKSLSTALFGNVNPVGKTVRINNKLDLKVAGVYEDLPYNSTLYSTRILMAWNKYLTTEKWLQNHEGNWGDHSFRLYVQLNEHSDFDKVTDKIKGISRAHYKSGNEWLMVHPMDKWHLYSNFKDGKVNGGLIQFVWLFGIIGLFVLLLACINFMNLSTARSEKRAKEVGIRKSIGSLRRQLVGQFLSESVLLAFIAFVFSIILSLVLLPMFNGLASKQIYFPWANVYFWLISLMFVLFTGLVSGSYPAFYLSGFNAVKVLKGTFKVGRFAALPRKVLVVVQFTVSVILIIGTLIVFRQIQFAKNRPVGYNREGLITVDMNTPDLFGHYDAIRNDLLNTGAVENMAESSSPSTDVNSNSIGFSWQGKDPNSDPLFGTTAITYDYGKTIGWKIKEGRDFSKAFATDTLSMLLNEAAVKLAGFKNPIGETIHYDGKNYIVRGVIQDMVTNSPYVQPMPTVYMLTSDWVNFITIRLKPAMSAHEALAKIEPVFKRYNPSSPFNYKFTDDEYAYKFADEERVGKLATFFSILAIFISSFGLFGLASFVAEQRTKEIGVRKVLGATVYNLWGMLSKDFVALVFISCLIAIPVAGYTLSNWLKNYEYHTGISWWVFIIASAGCITITLLTVSFQAIKAAIANPVKSLRTE